MIHSRKIQYFLAAAEHLHFTIAAEKLHISQPALSRGIRQLEDRLGVPLFERTAKGVVLTRHGEFLARRFRLMTLDAEHTLAELETIKAGIAGTLHIGAGPVWLRVFLPPVIGSLQLHYPDYQVNIMAGVIDTLLPQLMNGKLDVICGDLDFPDHPELETVRLTDIRFVVVAHETHPLAGTQAATARDLTRYPWLTLRGHYSMRNRISAFFAAHNLEPPKVSIVISPGVGNFDFLSEGEYLTTVPTGMLPLAQRYDCVQIPTSASFGSAPHGVVYRRSNVPEALVTTLISILKDRFKSDRASMARVGQNMGRVP